jgi:hypothetical protein
VLIVDLDTPEDVTGNTRVRYLRYEDAVKITWRLEQLFGLGEVNDISSGQAIVAVSEAAPEKTVRIWAHPRPTF